MITIRNLAYGADGLQRLDLHRPDASGTRPAVLFFHGGKFMAGDKSELPIFMRDLTAEGWAVISANYRLAPGAVYDDMLADARAVAAWARASLVDHGVTLSSLLSAGSSAGGALALMLAHEARVDAVAVGFPVTDLAERVRTCRHVTGDRAATAVSCRAISPIASAPNGSMPTFVAHGALDRIIPPHYSHTYVTTLQNAGTDTTFHLEARARHHWAGSMRGAWLTWMRRWA